MLKPTYLAALAVLTLSAGTAGYFGMKAWRCQDLEADYLNIISSLKSNARLASFSAILPAKDKKSIDSFVQELQELEFARLDSALRSIHEQCGTRAGETAARKGSDVLLD